MSALINQPPPGISEEEWETVVCWTCTMYLRQCQTHDHIRGHNHRRESILCKYHEKEERQRQEESEMRQEERERR